jgi:drug/metabolite transporter (DMT)-like permease
LENRKNKSSSLLFIILSFAMLLWGGTWITGKILSGMASFFVIVAIRFLLSAAALVPLMIKFKSPFKVSGRSLWMLISAGVVLSGYNWCFFAGLKLGFAGEGGVLVTSLNPVITFILSALFLKASVGRFQKIGLTIGFLGSLLMLRIWEISAESFISGGTVFFLGASCCWAVLSLISHRVQEDVDHFTYSFYVYGITGILNAVIVLFTGGFSFSWDPVFWGNIFYISVIATAGATTVYFLAAGRLGGARASSFIFIVPASALFFSWLILGEVPHPATVAGGALTIWAVYLINNKSSEPIEPAPEA